MTILKALPQQLQIIRRKWKQIVARFSNDSSTTVTDSIDIRFAPSAQRIPFYKKLPPSHPFHHIPVDPDDIRWQGGYRTRAGTTMYHYPNQVSLVLYEFVTETTVDAIPEFYIGYGGDVWVAVKRATGETGYMLEEDILKRILH